MTDARVPISKSLVLVNMLSTFVARALNVGVLLWLQQYLLRRISPAEYSIFPVLMGVMAFTPLLSSTLTSGVGRYVTEALTRGDDERITQILSTIFPVLALMAAVLMGAAFVASLHIDLWLDIEDAYVADARLMLLILAGAMAVEFVSGPHGSGLYARQRLVAGNLIEVGGNLIRAGLLLTLLLGVSTRVIWVAVAYAAGVAFTSIMKAVASKRAVPALRFRPRAFRLHLLKTLVSFGSWNMIRRLSSMIKLSADPLILNRLATPVDVSCFYLGSIFRRQTMQGWSLASTSLSPVLTALSATDQRERMRNAFLRGSRYALWATLAVAAPLAVYREEVFALYAGREFIAAAPVTLLLLLAIPMEMSTALLGPTVYAVGAVRDHAWRAMAIQAFNLALTFWFVGALAWGATGSAAATLVSTAVLHPLLLWPLAMRITRMPLRDLLVRGVGRGLAPAAAGSAVWIVLQLTLRPAGWGWIFGCSLIGGVVYLGVMFSLAMEPCDRRDLGTVRRKVAAFLNRRWNRPAGVGAGITEE